MFSLPFLFLYHALHLTVAITDQHVNDDKISVIAAYQNLLIWHRQDSHRDSNFARVGTDLFERMVTNALGHNFDLVDEYSEETDSAVLNWVDALSSQTKKTMETEALLGFYSNIRNLKKTIQREIGVRDGTCASFIKTLVPHLSNFFNYTSNSDHDNEPARKLISKYLRKGYDAETPLKKSIKQLVKEGNEYKLLDKILDLCLQYTMKHWLNDQEVACSADLAGVNALLALEEEVYHKLPDRKRKCYERVGFALGNEIRILPQEALENMEELLVDRELIDTVFSGEEVTALTEQLGELRQITNSSLALLSLPMIRQMLTGEVIMKPCESCNCKLQDKFATLKRSIDRMKSILPQNGEQCQKEMRHNSYLPNLHCDCPIEWSYIKNNVGSMESMNEGRYRSIKLIFEIFDADIDQFYWLPYIGLPFAQMPVKHALWWVAAQLFPYTDCRDFAFLQLLIQRLEAYSRTHYVVDYKSLEVGCGYLEQVNTEESFVLAFGLRGALSYDVLRRYNFTELTRDLGLFREEGYSAAEQSYELLLLQYFSRIFDKELSPHKQFYQKLIEEYGILLSSSELDIIDTENTRVVNNLVEHRAVCEMFQFQKSTHKLHKMEILNFIKGRIEPSVYENQIYIAARQRPLERNLKGMENCQISVEREIVLYQNAFGEFLRSDFYQESRELQSLMRQAESSIIYMSAKTPPEAVLIYFAEIQIIADLAEVLRARLYEKTEASNYTSIYDDLKNFGQAMARAKPNRNTKIMWHRILEHRNCLFKFFGVFREPSSSVSPLISQGQSHGHGVNLNANKMIEHSTKNGQSSNKAKLSKEKNRKGGSKRKLSRKKTSGRRKRKGKKKKKSAKDNM